MKHSMKLSVLFALAPSVGAALPPPGMLFQDSGWEPTLGDAPSAGGSLGGFRVQFETTTLSEVKDAAALGIVSHRGDASESVYWLCYTVIGKGFADRIWIISSGEMGGATHAITGLTAQRMKGTRVTASCPSLPVVMQPIRLDHGIWLGSTARDVSKALGVPSRQTGAWRAYEFEKKVPGSCEGGFDLMNWLLTKSERGVVTSISAGQITSC